MSDGPHLPKVAVDYNGSSPDPNVTYNDYIAAWSTAPNLYAYDNAFFAARLLSGSNMKLLLTPRTAVDPPDAPGFRAEWGFGWKVGAVDGRTVFYTAGRTKDFQTVNMRFPRTGQGARQDTQSQGGTHRLTASPATLADPTSQACVHTEGQWPTASARNPPDSRSRPSRHGQERP
jgi:hypothetical protein